MPPLARRRQPRRAGRGASGTLEGVDCWCPLALGCWLLAARFWKLATGNWQLVSKSKSPGVFDLPGFGYVVLRSMFLFQDINACTEGREAPGAAYSSSNNYTRRDSLRTFGHL